MINAVTLRNFGPISEIDWRDLGRLNLIIGENGVGKTFLLKAMYSAIRTLEDYRKGNNRVGADTILQEKLYWTFQTEQIQNLVNRNGDGDLEFNMNIDRSNFKYSFGLGEIGRILANSRSIANRESNSIFIPAKEVISICHIILKSRDQDKLFGFDDTYLDLARALSLPTSAGRNFDAFSQGRRDLGDMIGGRIVYNTQELCWEFRVGNQRYAVGAMAEGVKKIAILDTLLGNRYLAPNSVIFFDEIESALHPKYVGKLLEIVSTIVSSGIQVFISSHSYFVIKNLFLISQQKQMSIPYISIVANKYETGDMIKGMPDNPIIDESIRLYEQEVGMVLG